MPAPRSPSPTAATWSRPDGLRRAAALLSSSPTTACKQPIWECDETQKGDAAYSSRVRIEVARDERLPLDAKREGERSCACRLGVANSGRRGQEVYDE